MKYLLILLMPLNLLGQNITLKLDRDDIKTLLIATKQSMVYDSVTIADKQSSIESMERIISRDRPRGNVDLYPEVLAKWLTNKRYQVEEFYRTEDSYKQSMRILYEVYLQDGKLKLLKQNDPYGEGNDFRKLALRDIRAAEKESDTSWLKKKYRETAIDLDDDGKLKKQ